MRAYRPGDRVRCDDGRFATLVRQNRPYKQWLVEMDAPHVATYNDDRLTWWWESMFSRLDGDGASEPGSPSGAMRSHTENL